MEVLRQAAITVEPKMQYIENANKRLSRRFLRNTHEVRIGNEEGSRVIIRKKLISSKILKKIKRGNYRKQELSTSAERLVIGRPKKCLNCRLDSSVRY